MEMSLAQTIRRTCRELQERWARMADSAFGRALPADRDETARGEFISDFITERGLSFPAASRQERPNR